MTTKIIGSFLREGAIGMTNLATRELREKFIENHHTAFIGKANDHDEYDLFIITPVAIFQPNEPLNFYEKTHFYIDRWVDIEIKVIGP